MSSPIQPSGTESASATRVSRIGVEAVAPARGPAAARGGTTSRSASSSARRASSTPSSSTSESPVGRPIARKNAKHIAPPIRIASAISQEPLDHADLVAHLGATEDDDERVLGFVQQRRQHGHLALEQEAGDSRPHPVCDALRGGMSAVRGAEGVVHVHVAEACQRVHQRGVVPGLAPLEAAVLQHQHLPVAELLREPLDLRPDNGGRLAHLDAEQLTQAGRHGRHRVPRIGPVRPVQVRDEHEPRPSLAQVLDRRQRGPDATVVRHPAAVALTLERDVEVHPHERPPPAGIDVPDGLLREGARHAAQASAGWEAQTFSASSVSRHE